MEKVSIMWWNSMNFGILFLVFSSLLISATWFLSPSLLSLQFPWNNFYQQGKLIVAKSKEYFSVLVLIDLPPQHLTLWKTPFLLHTLILDFPDIIPPGHCLITPSQSLCKCFFNLDPFRVVAKGDTKDSFFFFIFLNVHYLPDDFIYDCNCFLLAKGRPNLSLQALISLLSSRTIELTAYQIL